MSREIYPDCGRENNFSGMYCKLAMESYCRAEEYYKEISEANFSMEKSDEETEFSKQVVSTVVFSAMCLESFFNNYLAACLGDKNFYETYDNLSPVSKLCLITDLLFRIKIDKSKSYYAGIKNLFYLRNRYVHNKSKHAASYGFYTEEEIAVIEELRNAPDNIPGDIPHLNKKEIQKDLKDAYESLKAIRDVAKFFDENDANCFAMVQLFGAYNYSFASAYEQRYMKEVFAKLGIKKA